MRHIALNRWLWGWCVVVLVVVPWARGQNRTWFGPDDGLWSDAPNWLPANVPDTNTENATFGGGVGGVVFNGGFVINEFRESGGHHTFYADGPTAAPTLSVAGDAIIARSGLGTSLTLAQTVSGTAAVNLDVAGELGVYGDGAFHLADGAEADAATFGLGNRSTGDGEASVDGSGSNLTISGSAEIGAQTSTGTLTVSNLGSAVFLNGLDVVTGTNTDSSAVINVQSGGGVFASGDVNLGTGTGTDQTTTLTVTGVNGPSPSFFTHTGSGALTFGNASAPQNTLVDINDGAVFQTGNGQVTVAGGGEVRVSNATLQVFGDLTVNGRVDLQVGSVFELAAGRDLTLTGGGDFLADTDVTMNGGRLVRGVGTSSFELADGRTYFANGVDVDLSGVYTLNGGATFDIRNASTLSASMSIGLNSDGTLIVDGVGTSMTSFPFANQWGTGAAADVTFRNFAVANLGFVDMAESAVAGTVANLNIESNADVTVSTLNLATQGGSTTAGRIDITGGGDLTQTGAATLNVGHAFQGSAEIRIDGPGSTFTTGTGNITVNTTGLIEALNDGVFEANGNVVLNGGTLRTATTTGPDAGTFTLADGKNLTATNDAQIELPGFSILDQDWNIQNGSDLRVRELNLVVGNRREGTLTVDGIDGTDTSVVVDAFGLVVGVSSLSQPGQGTVTVRDGGRIDLDDPVGGSLQIATDNADGTVGTVNIEAGGTVNVASTVSVAILGGANTIGILDVRDGGTLTQTGSGLFRLGQVGGGTQARVNLFNGGVVSTGTGAVTLEQDAELNLNGGPNFGDTPGVFIANGPMTVRGQVNVPQFDGVVTDPGGRLVVNAGMTIDAGYVQMYKGAIEADAITLTNGGTFDFTGGTLTVDTFTGTLDQEGGTLAPGDSPGVTTISGDYLFNAGSLAIEIGGTTPGAQHDRVEVAGFATLLGTLDVTLINGFTPTLGDSFAFLFANGGFNAGFSALNLPDLSGQGLDWQLSPGGATLFLNVVATASLLGDYNDSGQVEQGDLDLVLQNWGLDTDANGVPTGWTNDLPQGLIDQAELDGVLLNWGDTAAPDLNGSAAVPEPVGVWFVASGWGLLRRRLRRVRAG